MRTITSLLMLPLLLGLLQGVTRADEPIEVTVLTILATKNDPRVDPGLKEIAERIRRKDSELTGFALKNVERCSLEMGKSTTLKLIETATVDVMVHEKTDENDRVTMTIKPPKLEEIKYACSCGKFFPIITNYYTRDGGRLIIAVMAKPCMPKSK